MPKSPARRVARESGARQVRFGRRRSGSGRRERWGIGSREGLVDRFVNKFVGILDPVRGALEVFARTRLPNVSVRRLIRHTSSFVKGLTVRPSRWTRVP